MKELTTTTAFKAMQTDIQVSMDDVVSAFVSQYENNLYDRKKELTTAIKAVEATDRALDETILKKVTGDSFDAALPMGLTCKVSKGELNWSHKRVNFKIKIALGERESGYYSNNININKHKPIPAAQIKTHKKLEKELEELRSDLGEVLVALKSITRKERQVRGRIAVRKLEDSGYANLMEDSELAQLVQLDD